MLILALVLGFAAEPLHVESRIITKGPFYVGQPIEIRVNVSAGSEPPKVAPPRNNDMMYLLKETGARPVTTSAIGNLTLTEKVVYSHVYLLVPKKAGNLSAGPFRASASGSEGASSILKLRVELPPASGRPREFLGGVGGFTVEAEVSAESVRVGGRLTYQVTLTGEAALGSTGELTLNSDLLNERGLEVTPGEVQLRENPATRVYPFEVRAMKPGTWAMPGVRVASFDPSGGRYLTRVSNAVEVVVSPVPAVQAWVPVAEEPLVSSRNWLLRFIVVLCTLFMSVYCYLRMTKVDERSWARKLIRRLASGLTDQEVAQLLLSGLQNIVGRKFDSETPALSALEVAQSVESQTADRALADRFAELVNRCDRVIYGGYADAELHTEAKYILTLWINRK